MRRARKPINQINVVPYIDVMLVLLIIFMVTAPLVAPGEIQLPSVGSKLTVAADPVTVHVKSKALVIEDRQGSTSRTVNASLDTMVDQVESMLGGTDRPVVIAADGKVPYEDVVRILDRLQLAGIKRVGLLARPTP